MSGSFRLEERDHQVLLLSFDQPNAKVNTMSTAVLGELETLVADLEQRSDCRGLLLASGKPGQFIAGADLRELAALSSLHQEQAAAAIDRGHRLLGRISDLPFPTVALIDGICVGGGTELVLALDYRLLSNDPKLQIGLPETKLGIIPGWGGTQRLPRLVGVPHAIELIASGELIGPQRAVAIGLAVDAVPRERLLQDGCRLIEHAQSTGEWRSLRTRRRQPVGLSEDQMQFAFAVAEGQIQAKTKGQYPAPLAALRAIRNGCNLPLEEALAAERAAALEVVGSPIAANLISVFFMTKRLERDPGVASSEIAPRPVRRVGVLGAGLMGAGIAAAHARRGIPVGLVDVDDQRLAAGLERAQQVVTSRIKIGRARPEDLARMLASINATTNPAVFADCDLVIEAVTENEQLKGELYRKIAGALRSDALLASNTSTISITRLAEAAPDPARFCGMHFFNPVDRMQLVEVIRGQKTDDATVATVVALAKQIGKTPIVVRDCPGFLVNRVLFPYMIESLLLLLEGAEMDAIDRGATRFGMPMGPILLHDVVGIDTAYYAGKVVHQAYPDRVEEVPLLREMVQAGRLGQKSGTGFRKYDKQNHKGTADPAFAELLARHRTANRSIGEAEITDRLFLPMLLEATRVLEESIVREPGDVDMGLILGIGFPPFRGGILRWCDSLGAAAILDRLDRYQSLGKRFHPTALLEQLARTGGACYPTGTGKG